MTYVTQLRAKHAAEKAHLAKFHAEQKDARATMIRSWTASAAREKRELAARHSAQLPLTKKYSQGKNAAEKAQLAAQHKREKESWESSKKTWAHGDRIEKEVLADKQKNEMAYAVKMAKKK